MVTSQMYSYPSSLSPGFIFLREAGLEGCKSRFITIDSPNLESNIDARVLDLVGLIQRKAVDKIRSIDFAKFAQFFTLDSLTQIGMNGLPRIHLLRLDHQ